MHYAHQRRGLGFYVDLHGHMNKRVFSRLATRSTAKTPPPALRTPGCARSTPRTSTCTRATHREEHEDAGQERSDQGRERQGGVTRQDGTAAPVHGGGELRVVAAALPGSAGERGRRPRVAPVAHSRSFGQVHSRGAQRRGQGVDDRGAGPAGRGRQPVVEASGVRVRESPRRARVGEERGEGRRGQEREGTSQGSKMLARSGGR